MKTIIISILLFTTTILIGQSNRDIFIPAIYGTEFYIKSENGVILARYVLESYSTLLGTTSTFAPKDSILYNKWYKRVNSARIISEISAISRAQEHFTINGRKGDHPMLICDDSLDRIYWRLHRRTGFTNVFEQGVLIDANNEEYIDVIEFKYHRSFFAAIGDWFSGRY